MWGSKNIRRACGLIGLGLSLTLFGQAAQAGPLYFNAGVSSGPTWIDDGQTANWSSTVGGGGVYTDSTWVNGSDAWFEGTAGAVSVSGSIGSVNSMTFSTDGYTLNSGTINLTGAGSITTSGGTDTINSLLTGTGGLTKLGTGMLVLNSGAGYTGNVTIANGTLQAGNNNVLPTGAILTLGDGTANTSGVLDLNTGEQDLTGLYTAGSGTANQVINSVSGAGNTGLLKLNITGTNTFAGQLGGGTSGNNFNLSLIGGGLLVLSGTNNTYTGATNIAPARSVLPPQAPWAAARARSIWATIPTSARSLIPAAVSTSPATSPSIPVAARSTTAAPGC